VGKVILIELVGHGIPFMIYSIRVLEYLQKTYGNGRWRKLKGIATVKIPNGQFRRVELHWYEAHGIGKKDMKIKRYLDE
jgi:hypothetical protein